MQLFTVDSISLAAMIRLCSLETLTPEQRLELIKAHLLNIKTPSDDNEPWDEF
ncbi:TPA: hypothetical protein N5Y90_002454 [Vibrio cholerae]|uniref:hypothetical protein n=1 Tax=Vibrio cholerae TaxID=666 RepID=UPI0015959677|nr:hypothetical protein [Vibrio cholerae]EJB4830553.1 hypothetical protein [Vibrio cholerae]EJB5295504.1 hypothetical protein [Vibrio cholerae]ELJ8610537.1 hypothetical protein [Vibrio cholerae]ELJ8706332.1 hypothetical protein [Vibrio cholerae]ELK5327576.1 hypothetical protein [Vibrio cholerae]